MPGCHGSPTMGRRGNACHSASRLTWADTSTGAPYRICPGRSEAPEHVPRGLVGWWRSRSTRSVGLALEEHAVVLLDVVDLDLEADGAGGPVGEARLAHPAAESAPEPSDKSQAQLDYEEGRGYVERGETALAAVAGDREELANEAADLLYHLLVLLQASGLSLQDVVQTLESRHS